MADKLHNVSWGMYAFHCPGCGVDHQVCTRSPKPGMYSTWDWNGRLDKPTFSPFIGIQREPGNELSIVCKSMVYMGTISFLPGSRYELVGQTVELPDWEEMTLITGE